MVLATRKLGSSGLNVTAVCLGTMTFGVQVEEPLAHQIIDEYIRRGGNFIDTAEMYPAPSSDPRAVIGSTEIIIGNWNAKNKDKRSKIYIATKVSGFNPNSETAGNRKLTLGTGGERLENGKPKPAAAKLDRESICEACDASLKRLQTEYIDLYQIHWPDRYVPMFGGLNYNPSKERPTVPIKEQVAAMKELIDKGKIKHWGLSNETTFGVCEMVREADAIGCPRPVSIQNMFCLVQRHFESDQAEACAPSNFNIGLLPWSPLAGGVLTDKYYGPDGKMLEKAPEASRTAIAPGWMGRYRLPRVMNACEQYAKIAKDAKMSYGAMSLRFCLSRWYAASTIIGVTSLAQLKEDLDAFEVQEGVPPLSEELVEKIDRVHETCMDCCLGVEACPLPK